VEMECVRKKKKRKRRACWTIYNSITTCYDTKYLTTTCIILSFVSVLNFWCSFILFYQLWMHCHRFQF